MVRGQEWQSTQFPPSPHMLHNYKVDTFPLPSKDKSGCSPYHEHQLSVSKYILSVQFRDIGWTTAAWVALNICSGEGAARDWKSKWGSGSPQGLSNCRDVNLLIRWTDNRSHDFHPDRRIWSGSLRILVFLPSHICSLAFSFVGKVVWNPLLCRTLGAIFHNWLKITAWLMTLNFVLWYILASNVVCFLLFF